MSVSYPRANSAYLKVAGLVSDSDFYRDDHQLIFRALIGKNQRFANGEKT